MKGYPMNDGIPLERTTCGAITRAGTLCQRAPRDNGRCNLHGGRSLAGVASPRYRHGRYSRVLPRGLAERYERALADPDLLGLRAEVALIDARLDEVLERLDPDQSEALRLALQAVYDQLQAAATAADGEALGAAVARLGELALRGQADAAAWDQVLNLIERRRTLVQAEWKRLVLLRQVMTVDQAEAMVVYLTDSIRRHVTDPAALAAIVDDVRRLQERRRNGEMP